MTSRVFLTVAISLAVAGAFKMSDKWLEGIIENNKEFIDLRRSESQNCTRRDLHSRFEDCSEPLEPLARKLARGNFEDIETIAGMTNVCVTLNGFKDCIGEMSRDCGHVDNMTTLVYSVLSGAVGFLCSEEGKEVFVAEKDCWKKRELLMATQTCGYITTRRARNECDVVEPMKICMSCSVELICNERAAKFVADFIHHAYTPAVQHMCESRGRLTRSILDMAQFPPWGQ